MGIKHLNTLLRNVVPSAITEVVMSELKGKKIAIDASIYMYRFLADDALLENIYLMISLFRKHQIIPVFIFDGYPSDLKYDTILERKQMKECAQREYDILINENNNSKLETNILRGLKRKLIKITDDDFNSVKSLISAYGITYYDAPSEADSMIAKMVQKKIVWGVLSDDTDYFAYGCRNILRYLSLTKETMIWYDLKKILCEMNMTLVNLREICVLSGTDYNKSEMNIFQALKYFQKYKASDTSSEFYTWLDEQKLIDNYDTLITVYSVYNNNDTSEYTNILKNLKNTISFQKINIENIKHIMSSVGFVFV